MYLAMELCPKGELYYFLLPSTPFPSSAALPLFLQLLSALAHSHSLGVAHRDLKPSNLLLTSSFSLKLADFGFAANTLDDEGRPIKVTGLAGSQAYAAPEVYANAPYDGLKADVFSLGVILYNICFQTRPFAYASLTDSHYNQFVNRNEEFWHGKAASKGPIDTQLIDLLNSLMMLDPTKRPNVEDIKAHPWISGANICALSLAEVLSSQFEEAQRVLAAKREEALRRKSGLLAGSQNRFKSSLNDSSTLSGSIGGEGKTLPPSEHTPFPCVSVCTSLSADEVMYSLRYLASIEEWKVTEDPGRYVFRLETEEANGSAVVWQVSLWDWEGVVRVDCRRVEGCYFEFYAEVEKLKMELAGAEI
jgi:serine/threonine protein kinase